VISDLNIKSSSKESWLSKENKSTDSSAVARGPIFGQITQKSSEQIAFGRKQLEVEGHRICQKSGGKQGRKHFGIVKKKHFTFDYTILNKRK
jgi:hypothetical protein